METAQALYEECSENREPKNLSAAFPARKAPVNRRRITTEIRTEYAVPTVNSKGKNPQVDTAQALSEESSEGRKTENIFDLKNRVR